MRLIHLLSSRHFLSIAASLWFVGLSNSIFGPYGALYLTDKAHLSPAGLGTLMTASAICTILIGYGFGRWSDRRPTLVPLYLAFAGSIIGTVLTAFTTNFWVFLAISCVPGAMAGAGFPQLFALAKRRLDASDPNTAQRGVSFMRALWSVAWVTGPAIGAALIIPYDYRGLLFASALCAVIAATLFGASGVRAPETTTPPLSPAARWQAIRAAGFASLGIALFSTAQFMGSTALSISIVHTMGGAKQDVGHALSLCAILEVLIMVGLAIRPVNARNPNWIAAGVLAFALYHLAIALVPTVAMVYAAQVLRAISIGLVAGLGISYSQSLFEGRAGAGAAMYSNSLTAGALIGGVATGAWGEAFGYQSMFGACAVLSGLGALVLRFQPRAVSPQESAA